MRKFWFLISISISYLICVTNCQDHFDKSVNHKSIAVSKNLKFRGFSEIQRSVSTIFHNFLDYLSEMPNSGVPFFIFDFLYHSLLDDSNGRNSVEPLIEIPDEDTKNSLFMIVLVLPIFMMFPWLIPFAIISSQLMK